MGRSLCPVGSPLDVQIRILYFCATLADGGNQMEAEDKRISLKIDVRSGTIELDAPADSFEQAIEKTKELTNSLDLRGREDVPTQSDAPSVESSKREPQARGSATAHEKVRSKPGKPGSAARAGRLASFNPENELLNEEQQRAIRDFRTSKAPSELHDEVLVALHQGEQLLTRQGFNFNQIYTLMWRAGTSPLPKALDEVLRVLMQQQLVERNDAGYFLKFIGRERVERELPRKKE